MTDRHELVEYFARLGFKTGAEIGVLAGNFSRFMCQQIPGLKLYSIDSWGLTDKRQKMRDYHIKMYGRAKKTLEGYNTTLIRKPSIEAVNDFEDNSLDFVYIDANHGTVSVIEDITIWVNKVRPGGIISGHDYDRPQTKVAVDGYVEKNNYKLYITEPDAKGIISWWFIKKMKNRIELAEYFARLGFKTGAEIGVHTGRYSRKLLDIIPGLSLYCVDCWTGKYTRFEAPAKESLSKYPGAKVIKGMSIDVAKKFDDNSLDFVYIDASHTYENVRDDILSWKPKVKRGGIVSGHDYQLPDVRKAVDEYANSNQITLLLADWDKEIPVSDDKQPSWYFVKQ